MKTNVEVSHSGKLYLVCTIEQDYVCSTSLETLQRSFNLAKIDANATRSGDALVIIVHLGNTSASLTALDAIKSAVYAIVSASHVFETAERTYLKQLNALAKDLSANAKTKSTSSPKKKGDSEGQ